MMISSKNSIALFNRATIKNPRPGQFTRDGWKTWFPSGTPESGPSLGTALSYTVSPEGAVGPSRVALERDVPLIGESEPFTLLNNSSTCAFMGGSTPQDELGAHLTMLERGRIVVLARVL